MNIRSWKNMTLKDKVQWWRRNKAYGGRSLKGRVCPKTGDIIFDQPILGEMVSNIRDPEEQQNDKEVGE